MSTKPEKQTMVTEKRREWNYLSEGLWKEWRCKPVNYESSDKLKVSLNRFEA
ncbi:hypothetical protein JXA85_03030 [Candidatus Woesearchaeota archaeon]|nr:hypothetical protein [Candidatus Woesearchaeota archaeon]